jgi:hypothetical protein
MTNIPSNQSTNDFIFRKEVEKGYPFHEAGKPHLLVIDGLFNPSTASDAPIKSSGPFHSLDVTVFRDGNLTNNVDLHAFHHRRNVELNWFSLEFFDAQNIVSEHRYLLTVILRYLV